MITGSWDGRNRRAKAQSSQPQGGVLGKQSWSGESERTKEADDVVFR